MDASLHIHSANFTPCRYALAVARVSTTGCFWLPLLVPSCGLFLQSAVFCRRLWHTDGIQLPRTVTTHDLVSSCHGHHYRSSSSIYYGTFFQSKCREVALWKRWKWVGGLALGDGCSGDIDELLCVQILQPPPFTASFYLKATHFDPQHSMCLSLKCCSHSLCFSPRFVPSHAISFHPCREFYTSWFTAWGGNIPSDDSLRLAGIIDGILAAGASINLYVSLRLPISVLRTLLLASKGELLRVVSTRWSWLT